VRNNLSEKRAKRYKGRLKEVYDELSEFVSYYVDGYLLEEATINDQLRLRDFQVP
jgi:hypothetical protein